MTRVKICGLTNAEDVDAAASMGADYLGFIHVPNTPRFVDVDRLRVLFDAAGNRAQKVLVVQDLDEAYLNSLRAQLDFDLFQFHGAEPPELTQKFRGYKVIHMRDRKPEHAEIAPYGTPFLLDTQVNGVRGGTGKTFDWTVLPDIPGDYLVAGGLTAENVTELVTTYQPWGVDVSSGVEAEKGVKDKGKLKRFIESVRRAGTL